MPAPPALNTLFAIGCALLAGLLLFSQSLANAGDWIHVAIFAAYCAVCAALYWLARVGYALSKASLVSCVALIAVLGAYFWGNALVLVSSFGLPPEYPREIRVGALFIYPVPAVGATALALLIPTSFLSQGSRAWVCAISTAIIFAIASNGLLEGNLPLLKTAVRWAEFLYFPTGVTALVLWSAPRLRRVLLNAA